jgi:hypothetical protein
MKEKDLDNSRGEKTDYDRVKLISCPICGVVDVFPLDGANFVYSCGGGHFWQVSGDVCLPLEELSLSMASVKLNNLTNQYRDELDQMQKIGVLDEFDFGCLDDLRAAQLLMVEKGDLRVFLRKDNSILYVLTSLIPDGNS